MFKKTALFTMLLAAAVGSSFAQSRVFKEVGKQISSKVEPIMQDNNLVGYIMFTQLEKVSKDSFSYKLDFLDENLNDIGNYSFRDINLSIQEAIFDNDVLLIGYLRTDLPNAINPFTYNKVKNEAQSSIYFQFLSLTGKMIKEVSEPVKLLFYVTDPSSSSNKFNGILKNHLRLQNIPGKGFAYSYGDGEMELYLNFFSMMRTNSKVDANSKEVVGLFDYSGERKWEKTLPDAKSKSLEIKAAGNYIYTLRHTAVAAVDGGYETLCMDIQNGDIVKRVELKDKKDRQFEVLHFANNPKDNQPIISGTIINKKLETTGSATKKMAHTKKPPRVGLFSMKFQDTSLIAHSTTWDKESKSSFVRSDGWLAKTGTYVDMTHSFSDVNGNVYYVGSGIQKKTRWVNVGISIATAPTLLIPYALLGTGIFKYKYAQMMVLKESPDGKLSFYGTMKYDNSIFFPGQTPSYRLTAYNKKNYFNVNQNKYLVLNDVKNVYIYDIDTKNVVKTIPHKKGSTISNVFRAKDGFIMISEYNANEKSTKLSIEAL